MDFGVVVGLDGLGGSASAAFTSTTNKHKCYGSENLKQERSGASCVDDDHDRRTSKLAKTAHHNYNTTCKANNTTLLRSDTSDTTTLFSSHQHQMLSFSSPKLQDQNATFPNYSHYPFSAYNRNSSTGVRGPFTPSQWMELEHQALIYKYISANVPIPSNLLIPIRKALYSAGFSTFAANLLRPNTFGWGSFHYGFSGNTDPEPGRCRRTDGKKWRCSRDAVADQKYCERHINRGRHRSRKPVEAQTKHLNNNNRMYMNKDEVVERMQDSKENPFDESSRTEFGHVSSDSLLNPSNKSSTLMTSHAQDCDAQHNSVRQFMDEWPKNQPELSISIPTCEFDPIHMGLGVGSVLNRETNWIPISWESSMGGPLGEVLHNTNSTLECKNLMSAGWDNSPRVGVGSFPTGVLHKTALSSPRAKNNRTTSLCNDLFGATHFVNSSAALPAL